LGARSVSYQDIGYTGRQEYWISGIEHGGGGEIVSGSCPSPFASSGLAFGSRKSRILLLLSNSQEEFQFSIRQTTLKKQKPLHLIGKSGFWFFSLVIGGECVTTFRHR